MSLTPQDSLILAAWVQAVGSIATIIVAFGISSRQTKAALKSVARAQLLADQARQRSILAIAEAANEHGNNIRNAFLNPIPRKALSSVYDKTIIDGVVRALTSVPAHEIGSRDAVMALLSLRDQFVFLGAAVDVYIAGPWNDPEIRKAIEACGPDQPDARAETVTIGERGLAQHVKVHLDKIRTDYESLAGAVGRTTNSVSDAARKGDMQVG
jgi:hypothetical protein